MDLSQGGPGADPGHRGKDGHPPREEYLGDPHPSGHLHNPEQNGPKVIKTPEWETPFHSPCGARGSSSLLSHSVRAESGGSGPGMSIYSFLLQACELEGVCSSGRIQANTPGRNRPSQTHPPGVL